MRVGARRRGIAAVLVLLAALSGACGVAAGDTGGDNILRYGVDLTPGGGPILEPLHSGRGLIPNQYAWLDLIYDRLIYKADDGSLSPGLLESWSAPDPLTAVLTLRPGIRFQDGTPLDAEALKYNWERDLAEPTLSPPPDFAAVETIEVLSPVQVRLRYSQPVTSYAFNLTLTRANGFGAIVSPTAAEKYGADYGDSPVGAGPYEFEKLERGEILSLRKWDGYWNPDSQHLDGVDFMQNGRGAPMISALAAGRIDIAPINLADMPAVEARPELKLLNKPGNEVLLLDLRVDQPPFDDPLVREALSWAFDREMINTVAYAGEGEPTVGLYYSNTPYYDPELADSRGYDPDKARALLQEAGLPEGTTMGMLVQNIPIMVAAAEVVQAQLNDIGITVTINVSPNFTNEMLAKPDSVLVSSTNETIPYGYVASTGSLSLGYKSKEFDTAYFASIGATSEAEAKASAIEFQEILIEDAPINFLAQEPMSIAMSDDVEGVTEVRGDFEGPDLRNASLNR